MDEPGRTAVDAHASVDGEELTIHGDARAGNDLTRHRARGASDRLDADADDDRSAGLASDHTGRDELATGAKRPRHGDRAGAGALTASIRPWGRNGAVRAEDGGAVDHAVVGVDHAAVGVAHPAVGVDEARVAPAEGGGAGDGDDEGREDRDLLTVGHFALLQGYVESCIST